ncbi:SMP-30/gluconolactonase/LRE family protein [Actinophytocola gossypii]|uniref:SMP-30/gluconolactonase/LRE family protein n=1 Tax=Actinophytocola gossypii TaxID=2812003 RepID=A0ABT2JCV0_9PSEU|nr:SMP-30/gluconolactonase/LRE family protein [Actinophytocola gossypii]MCT2585698.1 SMP-30/gluconolactonase/LRE family protein [Actinophytocola gossypii]
MDVVPTKLESFDDRLKLFGDDLLERLHTGSKWTEGPAYFAAGRYLLWSDIPNDRVLRWDETTGQVGVFRHPAGYANGHTIDAQGRLVSCEQGNRRVTRTEHDGSITVLADRFDGKRLNSPNDVVIAADGAVWFTDPSYGIDSDYEGVRAESEIGACNVYRVDPATGEVHVVADDFDRPNGLAFSLDQRHLYIVDSRRRHLRAFAVHADRLSGGEVIAESPSGQFDGIRLDDQGRIWAAAADGVHCLHADGTLLGRITVPEVVSNICFGGPKRNRLFITASTSVYTLLFNINGARPRP